MKKAYYKLISLISGFRTTSQKLDFAVIEPGLRKEDLELSLPKLRKLNPSYVLIRELTSKPEVTVNKLEDAGTTVKCRTITFNYPMVFRNYPLKLAVEVKEFNSPQLALKLPPRVLAVDSKDISFSKTLRMYEEIVQVKPYVRKIDRKRMFSVPVIKQPLYKNTFSREQMKIIREKVAQQNNAGWANIQIFEIYDKFCPGFYSNVKQEPGTKNIECTLSPTASGRVSEKTYYLVIGQRKDNRQPVKAIIDSADIKVL
ncbi:MAG: hypothetical protein GX568_00025 [Candidatus Gastranaerophilales bacterium]|jgi:hypothetical protein|nr:hypothetical protein [Candidatus Gastranaerophilales bacterium]